MRAAVEKYATIGFCGGTAGCIATAAFNGNPLVLPLVVGAVIGTLTGATYGVLRARFAR
ncbi:MAG TPA: hypothetical protein VIV11_18075 [Kofleriaceae bacterium]